MDNPCVQLVIEYLMAAKQDLREHIFDNGISAGAPLVQCVQDFSSSFARLLDFKHEVEQSWEHLEIYPKFLLERKYSESSIFQILLLDSQDVLSIYCEHLIDSGAEGLDVNATELLLLLIVIFLLFVWSKCILSSCTLFLRLVSPICQMKRQRAAQSTVSIQEFFQQPKLCAKADNLVNELSFRSRKDVQSLIHQALVILLVQRWINHKLFILEHDDISCVSKQCV